MQASKTTLQEIIEGIKQYQIPLFQRPYSWTKQEWTVLWEDLLELCHQENSRPHFMGSIVTIQVNSAPTKVTKYLLIDGQQRLTTVFIILAALRDTVRLSKENSELAEEINNTLLINQYKKGNDKYKIQPTQLDREEFYQIIDNPPAKKNSLLTECYQFFYKKIKYCSIDIATLQEVLCNKFSLVSITLGLEDDPYLVFESLNAKGRPLTQADLIRNYIFMRVHPEDPKLQLSIYQQYWQPMQTNLEEKITDFIRHYLTRKGKEIKKNEVYFELKSEVENDEPITYLKNLYEFSEYYAKLLNPNLETEADISQSLHRINRLEVATVYPFLLNCYQDYSQEKITKADFITVIKILENFLLRRFVCNVQTRGLNKIFSSLYGQINKDSYFNRDTSFVERLKLSLQHQNYPKDREFLAKLEEIKLYGSNRTAKAKLILESIELFFNHKEKVYLEDLSIEHVMPQTLNKWWREYLGEKANITHSLLVHSLGNLTLTGYNSELSNDSFEHKRDRLAKSKLELNKYFSAQQSWRQEDIEARSRYLAKIAVQIWGFFGNEAVESTPINSLTTMKGKKPKSLKFFSEEYSVKSWRDVLEKTLNQIIELDSQKFEEIIDQYPYFVSKDAKIFISSRQLQNNTFVNVNLSANDIYRFCCQCLETAEISESDWQLKTE